MTSFDTLPKAGEAASGTVRIQALGSLRVWRDGRELDLGPPGRRAVLGLLVLGGGETVTMGELVDALWGDRPPRRAVNVVQTHVKHLRRLLEPDRPPRAGSAVLPHVNGGYALNHDVVDVDLSRVRALLADAGAGDTARGAELLGEALRLWHGPPLADIPLLCTQPKVVAWVAKRWEVVARYGDSMIATGAAADVLPEVAAAAAEQPFDEPAQARLIRAYHAVSQRAKAFEVYHEVRGRLVEELGIDPGPELRAVHAALLSDDPPVDAPRPALPVPKQLPAQSPGFTGRIDQLSILDNLLPAPDEGAVVTIAAVSGTAGVGKTALAVHWAHRVRDRFPDGQLYANLRGHAHGRPAQPIEILTQFLSALGIPAERVPTDLETASALYRTLMTDRKALVLLDNAAGPDQVRPLLPAGPGCMVVVTGRERMTGLVAIHGARQLTLDVLSPGDAVELLARMLGAERVHTEHKAAAEFAKLCGYLPVALRTAAADLVDHPERGIADYVLELQGDKQTAVRTASDLSYDALPDAERRLFRLPRKVSGADVSTEAVAGTTFGVDFNPAADRLRVISDIGQNLRHNLNDHTTVADMQLTLNGATAKGVTAAAYTNNDLNNATATTLVDLDTLNDQVALQAPANNGTLNPTGKLGVDASLNAGADIFSDLSGGKTVSNTAFAAFVPQGLTKASFYTFDILTGMATKVGDFPSIAPVTDVAVDLDKS